MPQPGTLKPDLTKLKNAIAAIVERGVRSIKRFTAALHNKCQMVVYIDSLGRTCSQFLRHDAFSGYHFEFSGDRCTVTNKETGDVYVVEFGRTNYCNCRAYKYDRTKSPCKHMKMVSELRGDLEKAITHDSYEESASQKECLHSRAIIGLDAHYCPDCKKSIGYGTTLYEQLLTSSVKKNKSALIPNRSVTCPNDVSTKANLFFKETSDKDKKQYFIDSNDVPLELGAKKLNQPSTQKDNPCTPTDPTNKVDLIFQALPLGCRLERTEDHISMEYNVLVWRQERVRGIPALTMHNIGRIVHMPNGIYTYRVRSGIARTFETTRDAIAYLVRVVGTTFEEIANAYTENEQVMRRRIARL